VCRIEKVLFPASPAAAGSAPVTIVAPIAAESARTSRRDGKLFGIGERPFLDCCCNNIIIWGFSPCRAPVIRSNAPHRAARFCPEA
jgi:hypothetical protein